MADETRAINTANDLMVGVQGDKVLIVRGGLRPLTPDEAKRFAAWLVVTANAITDMTETGDGPTFEQYLEAIRKT